MGLRFLSDDEIDEDSRHVVLRADYGGVGFEGGGVRHLIHRLFGQVSARWPAFRLLLGSSLIFVLQGSGLSQVYGYARRLMWLKDSPGGIEVFG